ncbi:MAG: P pilus assembly chaperone PapD [Arenicella sp.]|jgi:P pilus assembly chaperone PapD
MLRSVLLPPKVYFYFCAGLVCLALAFSARSAYALGDLTVTPTRVIFEGRDRSKTIHLVNRGNVKATYRVEFTQMAMDDDGKMSEIDVAQEGQVFADSMLRYSPRQVEIEPGGSQTIRIMVRKPRDLAAGEYRSHLVMYAIPDKAGNSQTLDNLQPLKEQEVGISIDVIYRVSIPVVIRHGDLNAEFSFSSAYHLTEAENTELIEVENTETSDEHGSRVSFTLERKGTRSVYGDIEVAYQPDTENQWYVVGMVKDFVVYVPNDKRNMSMALIAPEGIDIDKGQLKITFSQGEKREKQTLATTLVSLP